MNECKDPGKHHKYLRFMLIDCLNNVADLTDKQIDVLLINKERFWIDTLKTIHIGLNGYHD